MVSVKTDIIYWSLLGTHNKLLIIISSVEQYL